MLVILCGKSASGKDTLARELEKQGFASVVCTTTRPKRVNETDGKEYNFISKGQFLANLDRFVEYKSYDAINSNGDKETWYYGTAKSSLRSNADMVIVKDIQCVEALKSHCEKRGIETLCVYIDAPDEIRTARAKGRGSFNEKEWNRRMLAEALEYTDERIKTLCDVSINNLSIKESMSVIRKNLELPRIDEHMYTLEDACVRRIIYEEGNDVYNFTETLRLTRDGTRKDVSITKWDKKNEDCIKEYKFTSKETTFTDNPTFEQVKELYSQKELLADGGIEKEYADE